MRPVSILIDLDEVLVNFRDAAAQLHGLTRQQLTMNHGGSWWGGEPFWKPIREAGIAFWENLQPFPWTHELISRVSAIDPDWHVVSAGQPIDAELSYTGKVRSLRRLLGDDFVLANRFSFTHAKYRFANHHTVLIDDSEENCYNFSKHGGVSVLFPSQENRLKEYAHNPMTVLFPALDGVVNYQKERGGCHVIKGR